MEIILNTSKSYKLSELAKADEINESDLFYIVKEIDGKEVSIAVQWSILLAAVGGGGGGTVIWGAIDGNIENQIDLQLNFTAIENRIDEVEFDIVDIEVEIENLKADKYDASNPAGFVTEQDVQDTPRAFSAGQALDPVPTADGSVTLDTADGNYFPITITQATTFNQIENSGSAQSIVLHITVGGAGGFSVDFHESWKWHNDEMPDLPNITGDRYTLYGFVFPDNTVEVSLFNRMPI